MTWTLKTDLVLIKSEVRSKRLLLQKDRGCHWLQFPLKFIIVRQILTELPAKNRENAKAHMRAVRTVASFWAVAQADGNIFCRNWFYIFMRVWGTTFTLVDVRLSRVFLRKLRIDIKSLDFWLWKNRDLQIYLKFPPTVAWNVVFFTYVVADIFLYPKSFGSAQTVEFSRRTSSQNNIHWSIVQTDLDRFAHTDPSITAPHFPARHHQKHKFHLA